MPSISRAGLHGSGERTSCSSRRSWSTGNCRSTRISGRRRRLSAKSSPASVTLVESYGISARRQIVRARPGEIGRAVADVARDTHASLDRRRSDCRLDSSLSPALLTGCVVGSPRRAVPRDDRHATGRVKDATLQGPPARSLKRAVVGRPMATGELEETLLPKTLALPIFASDPLSSVAYATEAAMVVLIAASAAAVHLVFPISIGIAALLAIVVVSYRQTVRVYETSGGAYVVAKENLGTLPSLVGAAALLTDYVLTVAVSIAAGIFAVTSLAPSLSSHKVVLSLACLGVIVLVNLRGVRESGLAFALPTYGFVTVMFALVGVGLVKTILGHPPHAVVPNPIAAGTGGVTLFVLLRAFSSGSTALTGVEAIANGVNAFRKPHGKNAATTLAVLGGIAIALFLGVSYLAVQEHARPSGTASVVSQIARATFPDGSALGFMYYAVQALTLAILVLAANTSFQGFPRLAALLARDGFAPRQFTNLGDRLVFSNGMLVLATLLGVAPLALPSERRLAHPPLRDRRLHRVHAFPARDGALLAPSARSGLALSRRRQRRRRDGNGHRHGSRSRHEVRGRRLDRDDRHPRARSPVLRHSTSLSWGRAPVARRCGSRDRRTRRDEHRAVTGRVDRRGDRGCALVRPVHHQRALQGDPRSAAVRRTRRSSRAGSGSQTSNLVSKCWTDLSGCPKRSSSKCGDCRGASRTSSP